MTEPARPTPAALLHPCVVVLAAGAGSRLHGLPKSLVQVDGQTVLHRLLAALQTLQPIDTVVVLGHHAAQVGQACKGWPVRTVQHADPSVEQVASLRLGLRTLHASDAPVLVALADQPLIGPAELQALVQAWCARPDGAQVLQPHVGGLPGNPVMFSAAVRQALLDGPETMGCRQWQALHPQQVYRWASHNPHYRIDLDTPEDLLALQQRTGGSVSMPLLLR